jgi:hypothetical protein
MEPLLHSNKSVLSSDVFFAQTFFETKNALRYRDSDAILAKIDEIFRASPTFCESSESVLSGIYSALMSENEGHNIDQLNGRFREIIHGSPNWLVKAKIHQAVAQKFPHLILSTRQDFGKGDFLFEEFADEYRTLPTQLSTVFNRLQKPELVIQLTECLIALHFPHCKETVLETLCDGIYDVDVSKRWTVVTDIIEMIDRYPRLRSYLMEEGAIEQLHSILHGRGSANLDLPHEFRAILGLLEFWLPLLAISQESDCTDESCRMQAEFLLNRLLAILNSENSANFVPGNLMDRHISLPWYLRTLTNRSIALSLFQEFGNAARIKSGVAPSDEDISILICYIFSSELLKLKISVWEAIPIMQERGTPREDLVRYVTGFILYYSLPTQYPIFDLKRDGRSWSEISESLFNIYQESLENLLALTNRSHAHAILDLYAYVQLHLKDHMSFQQLHQHPKMAILLEKILSQEFDDFAGELGHDVKRIVAEILAEKRGTLGATRPESSGDVRIGMVMELVENCILRFNESIGINQKAIQPDYDDRYSLIGTLLEKYFDRENISQYWIWVPRSQKSETALKANLSKAFDDLDQTALANQVTEQVTSVLQLLDRDPKSLTEMCHMILEEFQLRELREMERAVKEQRSRMSVQFNPAFSEKLITGGLLQHLSLEKDAMRHGESGIRKLFGWARTKAKKTNQGIETITSMYHDLVENVNRAAVLELFKLMRERRIPEIIVKEFENSWNSDGQLIGEDIKNNRAVLTESIRDQLIERAFHLQDERKLKVALESLRVELAADVRNRKITLQRNAVKKRYGQFHAMFQEELAKMTADQQREFRGKYDAVVAHAIALQEQQHLQSEGNLRRAGTWVENELLKALGFSDGDQFEQRQARHEREQVELAIFVQLLSNDGLRRHEVKQIEQKIAEVKRRGRLQGAGVPDAHVSNLMLMIEAFEKNYLSILEELQLERERIKEKSTTASAEDQTPEGIPVYFPLKAKLLLMGWREDDDENLAKNSSLKNMKDKQLRPLLNDDVGKDKVLLAVDSLYKSLHQRIGSGHYSRLFLSQYRKYIEFYRNWGQRLAFDYIQGTPDRVEFDAEKAKVGREEANRNINETGICHGIATRWTAQASQFPRVSMQRAFAENGKIAEKAGKDTTFFRQAASSIAHMVLGTFKKLVSLTKEPSYIEKLYPEAVRRNLNISNVELFCTVEVDEEKYPRGCRASRICDLLADEFRKRRVELNQKYHGVVNAILKFDQQSGGAHSIVLRYDRPPKVLESRYEGNARAKKIKEKLNRTMTDRITGLEKKPTEPTYWLADPNAGGFELEEMSSSAPKPQIGPISLPVRWLRHPDGEFFAVLESNLLTMWDDATVKMSIFGFEYASGERKHLNEKKIPAQK